MKDKGLILAKPFVKWAGGKTQLLDEIALCFEEIIENREIIYIEPFIGGGAVLFWLLQHYPNIRRAIINDVNRELICCYREIKNDVEDLINALQTIQDEYLPLSHDERTQYYLAKRKLFNTHCSSDSQTAALFIFLNRTCFNGLYRVNSKGLFNVPHGKYANPTICDTENLRAVSSLLQRVEILCGDYSHTLQYAGKDSLYYFDPPYKPLTSTSAFTSYTAVGFDDSQQLRLRDFCHQISQMGSNFIVSNSDPDDLFFDNIYENYTIRRVSAKRSINSNPNGRGELNELLITNH